VRDRRHATERHPMTTDKAAWFVRSMADADTHRCIYSPATRSVHARCGIEFQPIPVGWPPIVGPLPGTPPDPDQICPLCVSGVKK
jgi:hypothetical protein